MNRYILILLLSILSCKNDTNVSKSEMPKSTILDSKSKQAQSRFDLKVYDYEGLEPLINKKDDNIHIVNFWATWCAPCIRELPYFEAINQKYKSQGVDVLLVSLDFPKKYKTKLIPFIEKHNLKSKIIAFDDVNQNRWIPAIHKDWSGALPATIIYKGAKRQFYERSFTQAELENELKHFLK